MRRNEMQSNYLLKIKVKRKKDNKADWSFRVLDGNQVIALINSFQAWLKELGIERNRYGEKYTLYSLRHFYAMRMLHKNVPVWGIARNMDTSAQNIEMYYGRSATPTAKATVLGGLPQKSSTALRSTPGRKSM